MEALNGNSSDKKSFPQTVKRVDEFYKQIASAPKMCFIGDSALYGKELDELNVDWLTRVPESYGECKSLCNLSEVNWSTTSDERYKISSYQPSKKKERWLLVRSEPAFHRENETFFRKHERSFEEFQKSLWHCSCQMFNCEKDAKKTIEKAIQSKKHFYTVKYEIAKKPRFQCKGRPKKGQTPDEFEYQVSIISIASDYEKIMKERETLGRFVLATNVLDKESMSDESMLLDYKDQGDIERGFRFIKNDTFGLDEVYLKKPSRIGALMAIMTLCLLVYGLTQYRLREALSKNNEVLPDQKSKPTQTPTLMWIFTLFSSITILKIPENNGIKLIVMNMQPLHQKIILLLGNTARSMYLLPENLSLRDIKLNQKTWLKWCGI
jgi:transposase